MKPVADRSTKIRLARDDDSSRELSFPPTCLSNGPYNVRFSEVGSGCSELGNVAITRWAGDETRDADGFYIYLRDLEDGFVWSAGYQPSRVIPEQYAIRSDANLAEISRVDREIQCRQTISVAPQHSFEVRSCRLTNLGSRVRRLDITSYLEWVLTSQVADRNHP